MVGALSDIGNLRKTNEDYIGFFENENIKVYIVADGMGGHNAGEVASKVAVDKTLEYIRCAEDTSDLKEALEKGVILANSEVYNFSLKNTKLNGMGTTITACVLDRDRILIANVGDSSCFVVKDDGIIKITKDHSLVQELIDDGSITESQARNHPNKNIITRALGTGSTIQVDLYELTLTGIEKIILCTDGLTNEIAPVEILQCIRERKDNLEACKELIDVAKARGGRDNISVMIFEGECKDDRDYTEQ
jgi:PPM family protein phosphatase